jgi:hypothetical protein
MPMRVDKHVRLNQAISMESIYHILTQRLIKRKRERKPHKWDMTSIRMKVNFVSVSSHWSSTKNKDVPDITWSCHKKFYFNYYCATSTKGVARQ